MRRSFCNYSTRFLGLFAGVVSSYSLSSQFVIAQPRDVLPPGYSNSAPLSSATIKAGGNPGKLAKRNPVAVRLGVGENPRQAVIPNFSNSNASAGFNSTRFAYQDRRAAGAAQNDSSWVVSPLGNSLAHVNWVQNNQSYALGASNPRQPLRFQNTNSSLDQLWRFQRFPGYSNQYLLESLQYPGYCATYGNNGFSLQPIGFLPTQQFWFDAVPQFQLPPVSQTLSQQVIANPALPPSQVTLTNPARDSAMVVLADLRDPAAAQQITLASGGSHSVTLDRDAGSQIVETFAVASPGGQWNQQQRVYQIPPVPLYDISVYEIFLQSIAIDRTGTSPNPIEDINYQPRSIGIFQVPPGDALPVQATIDVVSTANRSGNPGGVRPLPDRLKKYNADGSGVFTGDTANPLQNILDEIQSRRGNF